MATGADDATKTASSASVRAGLLRRGISIVKRHPIVSGILAAAGTGLLVFVLVYFQPQKLFIDQRVSEAAPAAPMGEPVAHGSFHGLAHGGSGSAAIFEFDGRRLLRLENLKVENGPDLFVYLSTTPADAAEGSFPGSFVNLGRLKGNIGSQNYDVPPGVELSRYQSVVIYCKRFSTPFAAAPLA
jgi:hypothetical protein